jgi:hypothetical protein
MFLLMQGKEFLFVLPLLCNDFNTFFCYYHLLKIWDSEIVVLYLYIYYDLIYNLQPTGIVNHIE